MIERDALITKKYILANQKINFIIEIFSSEVEAKKFLQIWKIELAKNVEYDSAWCAEHEKRYFNPSKNSILKIQISSLEIDLKKISLKLEYRID